MGGGGVSGYAALHSRVRVMYGELLAPQLGMRLNGASGLDELAALLKPTPYGPYLGSIEDQGLDARGLASGIRRRLAAIYTTIIYAAPVNTRSLLIQLFRHFEIDNLKALLRGLLTGASWEQVSGVLFPMGSLGVLPEQSVMEAGSVEAAVSRLSHTPYSVTLAQAQKRYGEEKSLFPMEVALDLSYWHRLWASVNQLSGDDRAQARRVLGPWLDMTNLMWALRYRVYYKLAEEEIINYTLPFGYRLHDADIRSVAAGGDMARVVGGLYPEIRDAEALLEDPERGLPKLELRILRTLRARLHGVFSGYPFHIGLPLALALLNELEVQDLTVWIESKAARMPAEAFTPYLLMDTALQLGTGG